MKKILISIILAAVCSTGFAQTVTKFNDKGIVKSVEYYHDSNKSAHPRSAKSFFTNVLKIKEYDRFETNTAVKLDEGHETYNQYYKGVKVEGGSYTFHFDKDGYLEYAHGNYVDVGNISVEPSISQEKARDAFAQYKGILPFEVDSCDAKLLIKEIMGTPLLVYKVYLLHPGCNEFGYVDAQQGHVVHTESAIQCLSAIGTFETRYNGTRTATTYDASTCYFLLDTSRGAIIWTRDANKKDFTIAYNYATDLVDFDNYWHRSEFSDSTYMALDVHWALQKIYDRLYNTYGKNSFDNQGEAISAYVRALVDGNPNNACWSQYDHALYFGHGSIFYNPFASVDVVAHEYGHGITAHQIEWNATERYLNEGLSDIWAAIMEYRINPQSVWKIGEQVMNFYIINCLRNIEHPDSSDANIQMASTYLSSRYNAQYQEDIGDYVRSGVFSHWFYLLVNGGEGYNDNSDYYRLDGIGMDLAERLIVKAVYSNYLRNHNNYPDVRSAFMNAALTLGGYDLVSRVANAWYAVGVGDISWRILGDNIPNGVSVYTIENVPENCTVTWEWQNGANIPITADPTATYRCYIDNSNKDYIHDFLVAKIYDSNGTLVNTLTKGIHTGADFVGEYKQDAYNIDWTEFTCGQIVHVYSGSTVTLRSQNFNNATFSFSGSTPSYWTYYNNTNTVTFRFIYHAPFDPFVPNSRNINLPGIDTLVVTGKYPNSYNTFQFTVIGHTPPLINPNLALSVIPSDNNVTVMIRKEDTDSEESMERTTTDCDSWKMTIANVATGRIMYKGTMNETSMTVSTAGWPQGIYVVKAWTDDASLSGKFMVGNP